MKKGFLLLITALLGLVASAQKVYFIYLQTEDQSPFYVRVGDKIYSSAASGFLILPNLYDSSYVLRVGFAKSTEPEAKFSVALNQNDKGYTLKRLEDGYALFDFEDMSLVKAEGLQKDNTVYETRSDNFSSTLSKAAGDPSLVKVPVVKQEDLAKQKQEKKEIITAKLEEIKAEEKQDKETKPGSVLHDQPGIVKGEEKENLPKDEIKTLKNEAKPANATSVATATQTAPVEVAAVEASFYKRSAIKRHSESSTTEGFGLVYFDNYTSGVDTIRIVIPSSKFKIVSNSSVTQVAEPQLLEKSKEREEPIKTAASNAEKATPVNSPDKNTAGCQSEASDKDFMKLRKRMAAKESDEEMLSEAKKDFRSRCYTVEQVRYLSTLYLSSAAKYQFFDAAFGHVSDKNNFSSLSSEIKEDYYARRFKALIGE